MKRNEVLRHVFDEDAFSLSEGKSSSLAKPSIKREARVIREESGLTSQFDQSAQRT